MVEHQPSKLNTWVRFPSPAYRKTRSDDLVFSVCRRDLEPSGFGLACRLGRLASMSSTGRRSPHHLLFFIAPKIQCFRGFSFLPIIKVYIRTKKGLRKIRRPVLMSTFNEYLFLFRQFLFLFFRNGEIQNAVLEACLDVFFCDLFTDIEASLH